MAHPKHTIDFISDHIALRQARKGYRFGLDALILATDLPDIREASVVYELGAAQGPVALSISARRVDLEVVAIERQEALFKLLKENIAHNEDKLGAIRALKTDLRDHRSLLRSHQADLVVCNPPYFTPNARRPSSNPERAAARHELHGTLHDFIAAGCYVLKHKGWFKIILPPVRLLDLFDAIKDKDLGIVSMRFIHPAPSDSAYLTEVLMRRGRGNDFNVLTPLYIRDVHGLYTLEVAQRLAYAANPNPDQGFITHIRNNSLSHVTSHASSEES